MTINEKAAYIKGIADGVELDNSTKEGKLIAALIDLVSEMAEVISDLEEDVNTVYDYCEELDQDLGSVEEMLLDDEDCDCDCDCDCCDCDDCDECCAFDDDDEYFEIECPSCGEIVCFDESLDPEELKCPACGEKFECIVSEDDLDAADAE